MAEIKFEQKVMEKQTEKRSQKLKVGECVFMCPLKSRLQCRKMKTVLIKHMGYLGPQLIKI